MSSGNSPDLFPAQLEDAEGRVAHVYQDSEGWWTIGVGILVDARKGGALYPEEIDFLRDNRIRRVDAALDANLLWARSLSPARRAVLRHMCFQLGLDGLLGFKNTLGLIKAGKYVEAAAAMKKSRWHDQTPSRCEKLADQMEKDEWQNLK